VVPVLPAEIAEQFDDASPAEDAVTDAAVAAFIADHQRSTRPAILHGWTSALRKHLGAGDSRHTSAVSVLTGAMKEVRAGFFAAQDAIDALQPLFIEAVAKPPTSGIQGEPRTGATAESEWAGILAWAVGQAKGADLDEVRARTDKKMPESPPPPDEPPEPEFAGSGASVQRGGGMGTARGGDRMDGTGGVPDSPHVARTVDAIVEAFSGMDPLERLRAAREVADRLEGLLWVIERGEITATGGEVAYLRGASLGLRAVSAD
jgi:hypothetical protein